MATSGTNSPNDILVRRIRSLPKVTVQNGLMRSGDRLIALSMMFMTDSDKEFLLSLLPVAKVRRIREELQLQRRLKITYEQYKKAVKTIYEGVTREGGSDSTKSYLRPLR
jgi:hypothetical protein